MQTPSNEIINVTMEYSEFFSQIELTIREAVRSCLPSSWEENHITFKVIDELFSRHRNTNVTGLDRPFKIVWDARKLRKPEESNFGDIGVLVHLTTWEGEELEGVGLIEAKRRDPKKNTFSAAKTIQLKRILSKAPASQILLYDYENVTSCMDNLASQFEDFQYHGPFGPTLPYTHAVCVSTKTAIQQGSYTTSLHKFGVPLSYQIVARYLRGLDLETKETTLEAVKGNIQKHGGPRILILAGVSTGGGDPTLPTVNSNYYGGLRDNI